MRPRSLLACLAALQAVSAFKDTSPFVLASSSKHKYSLSTEKYQESSQLLSGIQNDLAQCPSRVYVVISQPDLQLTDFRTSYQTMSTLRGWLDGLSSSGHENVMIRNVIGSVDVGSISRTITSKCLCQSDDIDPSEFSHLSKSEQCRIINIISQRRPSRRDQTLELERLDKTLGEIFPHILRDDLTLVITSGPAATEARASVENLTYEMQPSMNTNFQGELKRDLSQHAHRPRADNITLMDGPLFERYAFLSPGLFMGLLVTFPLLLILFVAVSSVADLQVSYAAFEKMSGPQSAKSKNQ